MPTPPHNIEGTSSILAISLKEGTQQIEILREPPARPTEWSQSGQDLVIVADPRPWTPVFYEPFPGRERFAKVIVLMSRQGGVSTGTLTIVPATPEFQIRTYGISTFTQEDDQIFVAGTSNDETATLEVHGPSAPEYEELRHEAELIISDAEQVRK